jgi:hypothetical protein
MLCKEALKYTETKLKMEKEEIARVIESTMLGDF